MWINFRQNDGYLLGHFPDFFLTFLLLCLKKLQMKHCSLDMSRELLQM